MIEITLQFDRSFISFLRESLKNLVPLLSGQIAGADGYHPGDALESQLWNEGLREHNALVLRRLLAFVDLPAFGRGKLKYDADEAAEVIQACSYVRLLIRNKLLNAVSDELLEAGEVDPLSLGPVVREAYVIYMALAHIQTQTIQSMG